MAVTAAVPVMLALATAKQAYGTVVSDVMRKATAPVYPPTGVTVMVEVVVVPLGVVGDVAESVKLLLTATVFLGQAVSRLDRSIEPRPLAWS